MLIILSKFPRAEIESFLPISYTPDLSRGSGTVSRCSEEAKINVIDNNLWPESQSMTKTPSVPPSPDYTTTQIDSSSSSKGDVEKRC